MTTAQPKFYKGDFRTFSKPFKKGGLIIPVGTRVVILADGHAFNLYFSEKGKQESRIATNAKIQAEYLIPAQPVICPITRSWQVANLNEKASFEDHILDLYHNGEFVGTIKYTRQSLDYNMVKNHEAWKQLLEKTKELVNKCIVNGGFDDFEDNEPLTYDQHELNELLAYFFIDNYNGLTTLNEYVKVSVQENAYYHLKN